MQSHRDLNNTEHSGSVITGSLCLLAGSRSPVKMTCVDWEVVRSRVSSQLDKIHLDECAMLPFRRLPGGRLDCIFGCH